MPLYRVAEQVEAEPEIFDVVIVDEASQTGPEGLILQYLAKQCVIVGDDKQISPEAVGVDKSAVRSLMEKHVKGIPFWQTLGPEMSLFTQGEIRYGNRIASRALPLYAGDYPLLQRTLLHRYASDSTPAVPAVAFASDTGSVCG